MNQKLDPAKHAKKLAELAEVFSGNKMSQEPDRMDRCIGCRWRTPKKFGGDGILCFQKDGKCPTNIIQWALRYTLNGHGKPRKSFANDEELLEALRL